MLTLYYIRAYSHRENEWRRFHASAATEEEARNEVRQSLPERGWDIRHVTPVCATQDSVFLEH